MIEAVPSMSEEWEPEPSVPAAPAVPPDPSLSAGDLMRRGREAAGLHIAALAVSLKVPVRKLEALETGRHDELTDAVFVRALAASVCRTLKIDVQPVLDRLPQSTAPRLGKDSDGINAEYRAPRDGVAPGWREQLSRPMFLSVFTLFIGVLVLALLPGIRPESGDGQATGSDAAKATQAQNAVAAAPERVSSTNALPIAPASPAAASAVPAPLSGSESGPAPIAAAPSMVTSAALLPAVAVPVVASPAAVGEAPAAGLAANPVVWFRASRGTSWVEVTDAKGVVAVRKVLAAGETTAASGALPLQVTVGKADITEVQVRGKPFDLRPLSRDNVARFEVK